MLISSHSCILAASVWVLRRRAVLTKVISGFSMKLEHFVTLTPEQPCGCNVTHIRDERKIHTTVKSRNGAGQTSLKGKWVRSSATPGMGGEAHPALLGCGSAQGPALIWSERGLCKAHPTQAVKSGSWILIISTATSCHVTKNYDLKLKGKEQADTLLWIPNPAVGRTGGFPVWKTITLLCSMLYQVLCETLRLIFLNVTALGSIPGSPEEFEKNQNECRGSGDDFKKTRKRMMDLCTHKSLEMTSF